MVEDEDLQALIARTIQRMIGDVLPKFKMCLDNLTHQQLWEKDANGGSIGSMIVDLLEHTRINVIKLVRPETLPDESGGPFFPAAGQDKKLLIDQLDFLFLQLKMELEQAKPGHASKHDLCRMTDYAEELLGQVAGRARQVTAGRLSLGRTGPHVKAYRSIAEGEVAR